MRGAGGGGKGASVDPPVASCGRKQGLEPRLGLCPPDPAPPPLSSPSSGWTQCQAPLVTGLFSDCLTLSCYPLHVRPATEWPPGRDWGRIPRSWSRDSPLTRAPALGPLLIFSSVTRHRLDNPGLLSIRPPLMLTRRQESDLQRLKSDDDQKLRCQASQETQ